MKIKRLSSVLGGVGAAMLLMAVATSSGFSQPFPETDPKVATATEDPGKESVSAANKASPPGPVKSEYTQNQDSSTLEEKIFTFNKQFCPPQTPISEISDFSLIRLVNAELIKRADLEKYKKMAMVDGKVYVKNDNPKPKPEVKPDPKPIGVAGNNLLGDFKTTCGELEDEKTRGKSPGNRKPEKILELKRRKITYRDGDNQLQEMEVFSPPKFPAKKKDIAGKKGKKVQDYATSILVPKNVDPKDAAAFEDMPSADAWLDDSDVQPQKK